MATNSFIQGVCVGATGMTMVANVVLVMGKFAGFPMSSTLTLVLALLLCLEVVAVYMILVGQVGQNDEDLEKGQIQI